jgi:hypothetical protein
VTEHVVAGGGGLTHLGQYEADGRAGWTPACGEDRAARWFRSAQPIDCPRCLGLPVPWTAAMVLDAVDNIADHLEREQDEEDLFDRVEAAVARLRALRGDSTGETDPAARLRAITRLYGTGGKADAT